jgi:hypothetical protein
MRKSLNTKHTRNERQFGRAINHIKKRSIDPPLAVLTPDPPMVPLTAVAFALDLLHALGLPRTLEESRIRRQHLVDLFSTYHPVGA